MPGSYCTTRGGAAAEASVAPARRWAAATHFRANLNFGIGASSIKTGCQNDTCRYYLVQSDFCGLPWNPNNTCHMNICKSLLFAGAFACTAFSSFAAVDGWLAWRG